MNVLIVEDDYYQAQWIEQKILETFKDSRCKIIRTEREFREFIAEREGFDPDIIILDVILPWTMPDQTVDPPPREVKINGRRRAGMRCQQLLAADPETQRIPVVLYTVLEEEDLKEPLSNLEHKAHNVIYLSKQSDPKPLIETISRLMQSR